MGIHNLIKLINNSLAYTAITHSSLSDLKGKTIAIDASIAIYQWYSIGRSRKIVNAKGQPINHIQGAFFRTIAMLTHGITPVYVFDGPPPASKAPVVMKRRALEAAKGTRIDRVVFEEVIALLRMMNIPIVMAPGEAEAQCARMATRGIVDAVYTNDTDALVFGASCMIYTMRASSSITTIDRDMVLKKLALNNNQFIDLCILLGSDYTGTLPGIGYKKAYGMIKKHGSIEAILANESIICPMVFDYVLARREFANPAVSDVAAISMNIDNVNVEDIREFLVEVHGLEPARIRRSISKLATLVSAA